MLHAGAAFVASCALTPEAVALEWAWRTENGMNWSQPANWGGTLPSNDGTADLVFSQIGSMSGRGKTFLDVDWNVRSLTWNPVSLDNGLAYIHTPVTPPFTLPVTTLTVHTSVTNGSGGRVEIHPNLVLGGAVTFHDTGSSPTPVSNQPGTFVLGPVLGSGSIQKTGPGILYLAFEANSYTGGTTVAEGVLQVPSGSALGTTTLPVQINGGTLRFLRSGTSAITTTISHNLTAGAAGATLQTGQGTLTLTGTIDGDGGVSFQPPPSPLGSSIFHLSGANTYAGGTTVGPVVVKVNGGSQSLGTGDVTLSAGAVLSVAATGNLGAGKKIAMKEGSFLLLQDQAISPAIVSADPAKTTGGTLVYDVAEITTPLDMAGIGNGALFLGMSRLTTYAAATLGAGSGGIYRLGGGKTDIGGTSNLQLTISGQNVLTGPNSLEIGGALVVLSQANNYAGGTRVTSGTLIAGHNQSLGTGPLRLGDGTTSGGIGSMGATELANPVFVDSDIANFSGVQPLTFTAPVDLGGRTVTLRQNGAALTFASGLHNGAATLQPPFSGNWTLRGTSTVSSLTVISSRFTVESNASLGAAAAPLAMDNVTFRPLSPIATNRPLTISGTGVTFELGGNDVTFSGSVSGTGPITKKEAGTLAFAGPGKTFGAISVKAGVLRLDDTGAESGMPVTVDSGATLAGTGSAGFTQMLTGSTLSPGTLETPGTFTFNSTLTLNSNIVLEFHLGTLAADKIVVNHGNFVAGANISVNIFNAGGLAPGQSYTLIDWSEAAAPGLSIENFVLNSTPVNGNLSLVGDTLQFTAVPEPSVSGLLAFTAMAVQVRRRRLNSST
jgi:fibronectin-binding autotransporter adhesin